MRILVLNYEFPPIGGGGGRASEDICRHLAARGHEIRVQTARIRGIPKWETRDGYTIYRTNALRRRAAHSSVIEMGTFVITNLFPAYQHARRWHPDLIHVHFAVPTGAVALLVSLITGIPYVLTVHLGDVPGTQPNQTDHLFRLVKPFTVPIWRRAASIVAVSDFVRQHAAQAYGVPVHVIPNGIDLEHIQPGSSEPRTTPHLLFAGRFDPQKNLPFLLEVLARITDLEWVCTLLGDGPLMQTIKEQATHLGLDDRVHLAGWVSPQDVEQTMRTSDILILPSTAEGLPVVGILALGYGLAIIGSQIGGLADIVQEGKNGHLCAVNDHGSFETALRSILISTDKLSDMKAHSRGLAQRFDLADIADQYEAIFNEALQ
jgi:glycosyltransferase involved in cell wall biosynthesis